MVKNRHNVLNYLLLSDGQSSEHPVTSLTGSQLRGFLFISYAVSIFEPNEKKKKYWINIAEVLELLPGPVLYYTKNSKFSKKILGDQCSEENLICSPFCATLEPPSAPARTRKNSLSTSTTAQVEECPGAPAPNPSTSWTTGQCGWRSSTLLSSNCRCKNADLSSSCAYKGLPDSSLVICTTALTQSLQHSGYVKALSYTTFSYRVGSPLYLLLSRPSDHWLTTALKRRGRSIHSKCSITAEMQALLCCHCLWGWKALYWHPEALSAIQAHRY